MSEIMSTELKDDLEYVYKVTGDLLNHIESRRLRNESEEIRELVNLIRFKLEDIGGVLQKDIFNCDYLITKIKLHNEEHK